MICYRPTTTRGGRRRTVSDSGGTGGAAGGRPRRVALVLASSTGGIGRHVAALTAGLVAAGDQVSVYGPAATQTQFGFERLGARFAAVEIPPNPRPADATAVRTLRRRCASR